MTFTKISLFPHESRGTFDDIFSSRWSSKQEAYANNDYVECNFVVDSDGIKYIEAFHVQYPGNKLWHRLIVQFPLAGLDHEDDQLAADMAATLLRDPLPIYPQQSVK